MNTKTSGKLKHLTSIYLLKDDHILLLYRQGSRVVNNVWVSSAGGHFENEELNDAKACVLRELNEELGLTESDLNSLQLRYVTLYHNSKDLRQNYYFFAYLNEDAEYSLKSNEGLLKWYDLNEISELEMPFTSRKVTEHFVKEGRFTDLFYAGISTGNEMIFHVLNEFE